jgi:hypothetical protein
LGAVLAVCAAKGGTGLVCAAGFHPADTDAAGAARQSARRGREKELRGGGFRAAGSRFYHLVKYACCILNLVLPSITYLPQFNV